LIIIRNFVLRYYETPQFYIFEVQADQMWPIWHAISSMASVCCVC